MTTKRRKRRIPDSIVGKLREPSARITSSAWTSYSIGPRAARREWLSIVDQFTRECLVLKVARSITSEAVIDTLVALFAIRVVPEHIRSDNGPEFVARSIQRWTNQQGTEALCIEPGSPWENGYAESFHSRLCDVFLATEVFEEPGRGAEAHRGLERRLNHHRPHSSLGYVAPAEFVSRCAPSVRATSSLQRHSGNTLMPS